MIDFNHMRRWALFTTSTGGSWLTVWYEGDQDAFVAEDGITYTRTGPIVTARGEDEAKRKIEQGGAE
jgi:hypothetical protein